MSSIHDIIQDNIRAVLVFRDGVYKDPSRSPARHANRTTTIFVHQASHNWACYGTSLSKSALMKQSPIRFASFIFVNVCLNDQNLIHLT